MLKSSKIVRFDRRFELVDVLKETYLFQNKLLLGIDGDKGSGKTNLSYFLGSELIINVVNLDDLVEPNKGCFVKAVDLNRLDKRIKNLSKVGSVIIEGVCLLEILDRIGKKLDIFIYCKEISENTNMWTREHCLDVPDTDTLSDRLTNLQGLDIELAKYSFKYKPYKKADFIYKIVNQRKTM